MWADLDCCTALGDHDTYTTNWYKRLSDEQIHILNNDI